MGIIKKVVKKVYVETSPKAKIKQERKKRDKRNTDAINKQWDNGKRW